MRHSAAASLRAFLAGSLVGVVALVVESRLTGVPLLAAALAVYGLAGGAIPAAVLLLLSQWWRYSAAKAAALFSIAAFSSLNLLYWVNLQLLPGEHFASWKSLAADAVVLLGVGLAFAFVSYKTPVAVVTQRHRRHTTRAGGLAFCGSVALLALSYPGQPVDTATGAPGPNLVLIVLDSARRDHLGLYGYGRATSPSLSKLADSSRVYEQAFASSPWTVPTVSHLLLGAPSNADEADSLPAALKSRGYRTGAFTDNPHLGRDSLLLKDIATVQRGGGNWRRTLRRTVIGEVLDRLDPHDDTAVVDKALRWAESGPDGFFLYVHLMDSHTPYKFDRMEGRRRSGRRIEYPNAGQAITADEAEDIVARYDAGLRQADAEAGRLIEALRRRGRPFVAIITSDHGESMGEEGRWFHGQSLAPELLAVPLIVIGDGVRSGRVPQTVGFDSIRKTLLLAGGVPVDDNLAGSDLRSSTGDDVVDGALPPTLSYRIVKGYKIVVQTATQVTRLFDLAADPFELTDLAAEKPELATSLAAGMYDASVWPPLAPEIERLRSLGYVGR